VISAVRLGAGPRACVKIRSNCDASAGRADARRRDDGGLLTSSARSSADDAWPLRPAGLRLPGPAAWFVAVSGYLVFSLGRIANRQIACLGSRLQAMKC
jgi:hypothetical protein